MCQFGQADEGENKKKEDGDDATPWCSRVSDSLTFCNHSVILINIVQCTPSSFITILLRSYNILPASLIVCAAARFTIFADSTFLLEILEFLTD